MRTARLAFLIATALHLLTWYPALCIAEGPEWAYEQPVRLTVSIPLFVSIESGDVSELRITLHDPELIDRVYLEPMRSAVRQVCAPGYRNFSAYYRIDFRDGTMVAVDALGVSLCYTPNDVYLADCRLMIDLVKQAASDAEAWLSRPLVVSGLSANEWEHLRSTPAKMCRIVRHNAKFTSEIRLVASDDIQRLIHKPLASAAISSGSELAKAAEFEFQFEEKKASSLNVSFVPEGANTPPLVPVELAELRELVRTELLKMIEYSERLNSYTEFVDDPPVTLWVLIATMDESSDPTRVESARTDARALWNQLRQARADHHQFRVLTGDASQPETRCTRENLMAALDEIRDRAEPQDVVIVSINGSCAFLNDKCYFRPADGQLTDKSSLVESGVLFDNLRACRTKSVCVLVDVTQEERPTSLGVESAVLDGLKQSAHGIGVLCSADSGQISHVDAATKTSIFMQGILQALSGVADVSEENQQVTFSELRDFVIGHVRSVAAVEFGSPQRPWGTEGDANTWSCPVIPRTPGRVLVNSLGMVLVECPAGKFEAGLTEKQANTLRKWKLHWIGGEKTRPAAIERPFYIGQTEVTQRQWIEVMGTRPWDRQFTEGRSAGLNSAASRTTRLGAEEFCRRLGAREGVHYRLPSEDEWEYACRGGSNTIFSFGDDITQLHKYAWFTSSAPASELMELGAEPNLSWSADIPWPLVARLRPNSFGLYDMLGNVGEYCTSRISEDQNNQISVARGSGGSRNIGGCVPASRHRTHEFEVKQVGFRVVREIDSP